VSPRAVFVAGAHTDVGKTHAACGLIAEARAAMLSVDALKPVVSGFDPADWGLSDPGRLLSALGVPANPQALEAISPWRFAAPLAPPMAAAQEGRVLPFAPLAEFCAARLAANRADLLVVEGVGGLMSPIADEATGLDLMAALGLPTLLVGGSYLGAISHTLTALDVLRSRKLPVLAVVVSESSGPLDPDFSKTVAALERFTGATPVIAVPRGAGCGPGLLSAVLA
jgi:dethiobiotin synthetase